MLIDELIEKLTDYQRRYEKGLEVYVVYDRTLNKLEVVSEELIKIRKGEYKLVIALED